jgi:3D (Asp-Asp-Asp) domain-containing protein
MRILAAMTLLAALCSPLSAAPRKTGHRVMRMEATAFVRDSKPTASGTVPHEGIVAADPAVLPLGSRISIRGADAFDGVYTVTDTGRKIAGRHIDLCLPNAAQAKQFGKKVVTVQVLTRGTGKEDAREKDIPAPAKIR